MGAIPYAGGVAFRVWAPFATAMGVAGSFNRWVAGGTPMTAEGGGCWSVDIPGAAIGDQYKFAVTAPGRSAPFLKNDPYARSMTQSNGNSIVTDGGFVWSAQGFSTPPWNEMVIYELHVGSFLFDPANPSGRGDFGTVIGQLGYLQDLGINVIQLLPADEFPATSSWGYNPAAIYAIEQLYGGPDGLRRLVDAAHAHGIAVIYDVVYNHLGPDDLDLWQFDGWSENGQGGIYFYNDWRNVTPWGATRPDYGRPEVRRFIGDNALHWLEEYRFDGLRFDATGWIRNVWGANDNPGADLEDGWNLLCWINGEVQRRQPWKPTIAEDMQDNERITRDLSSGGAGFGAQWGAGFMHAVRRVIVPADDGGRDMALLRDFVMQSFGGNAFGRVVYTESHDEVAGSAGEARVPELIWPGRADSWFAQKRSTLGAALVFTVPGIPMIFMGQEFLEWGSWSDSRELDWSKAAQFAGIRALYRDLIRLRRNGFDTSRGLKGRGINVFHVNQNDKVLAYHRWDQGGARDDVVVLMNFANRSYDSYRLGLPRGGRWRVRLNSDWGGYSPAFSGHPAVDLQAASEARDGLRFAGEVGLAPYSTIILSQDE